MPIAADDEGGAAGPSALEVLVVGGVVGDDAHALRGAPPHRPDGLRDELLGLRLSNVRALRSTRAVR
jgi:hypothetical protein